MRLTVTHPVLVVLLFSALLFVIRPSDSEGAEQSAQHPVSVKVTEQDVARFVYELAYSVRRNEVFVMAPVFENDQNSEIKPQVIRLNGDSLKIKGATELPSAGFSTVLDDKSNTLYIGTHQSTLIAYDTVTNKVKGEIQLAKKITDKNGKSRPTHFLRQIHLDLKNKRLYIPGLSWEDSVLYVVDTRMFKLIKTINNMGVMSTGITQKPDGGDIFLTNWQHEMVVIDSNTLNIKKRFSIPVDQPLFLSWNSEDGDILVVDEGMEKIYGMLKKHALNTGKRYKSKSEGNSLVVISPQSGNVLKTIPTSKQPIAVKIDNKRGRIYVTALEGGSVSIYSSKNYRHLKTLKLNPSANSLAINPTDGSVYVSVKNFSSKNKTNKEKKEKVVRLQF
ncbi:hypothetical protein NVA38_004493 [Escherichia coli]|uniref:YncE family protein n=1 Tax=Escherichia coli TaxID=562 RepID=A0A828PCI7_ECOLX|nr:hypothetical protein [Escherichia coli]EET7765592.1 hypothetical protein [Escherichia coli]EFA9656299.1 hypothetical protein [Escherichia coli]EFE8777823.1 hypothetical protein [Escherichia coli]EFF5460376.1 hypothetical protein [Escherichia coli]